VNSNGSRPGFFACCPNSCRLEVRCSVLDGVAGFDLGARPFLLVEVLSRSPSSSTSCLTSRRLVLGSLSSFLRAAVVDMASRTGNGGEQTGQALHGSRFPRWVGSWASGVLLAYTAGGRVSRPFSRNPPHAAHRRSHPRARGSAPGGDSRCPPRAPWLCLASSPADSAPPRPTCPHPRSALPAPTADADAPHRPGLAACCIERGQEAAAVTYLARYVAAYPTRQHPRLPRPSSALAARPAGRG